MNAQDFTVGDRFHFPKHKAFASSEVFTVERVEDEDISAQSDQPRWKDTPMIITNVSLAKYDDEIRFLAPGEQPPMEKKRKPMPGFVPVPKPKRSKKLVDKADAIVDDIPFGETVDFADVFEQATAIDAGELS